MHLHCRSGCTLTFLSYIVYQNCYDMIHTRVCVFLVYAWSSDQLCGCDLIGFLTTYTRLYPTLKPYEYGFRVFLITYVFITVSGYQTGEFFDTTISRFFLIAFGAAVSLGVNVCIYPIWAGEDLHDLVTKNFMGVATSLEGIVQYFFHHCSHFISSQYHSVCCF